MVDRYMKNNEIDMTGEARGKAWLNEHWPVMRVADVNWTMEKGDFPQHARGYIFKNWVKVNDEGGGTYCEPVYYEKRYKNNMIARGDMPPPAPGRPPQLRGFEGHPMSNQSIAHTASLEEKLTLEDEKRLRRVEDEKRLRRVEDMHSVPASQHAKAKETFSRTIREALGTKDAGAQSNGMDQRNQTALHVLQTKGPAAAVKHMFTDDDTGRELSYSEMRSRYG